jgi:hypothetical protein
MTNEIFIERAYTSINEKGNFSGKHQNLFSEGEAIYSYGYHYPLLFRVTRLDGKKFWIRNTRGYSNTTSKHINHAWFSGVVDVELQGSSKDFDNAVNSLRKQKQDLEETMDGKKRKDTKLYIGLQGELERVIGRIETLTR